MFGRAVVTTDTSSAARKLAMPKAAVMIAMDPFLCSRVTDLEIQRELHFHFVN